MCNHPTPFLGSVTPRPPGSPALPEKKREVTLLVLVGGGLFLSSPKGAPKRTRLGLDLDKSSMVARATVKHGGQDSSSPGGRARLMATQNKNKASRLPRARLSDRWGSKRAGADQDSPGRKFYFYAQRPAIKPGLPTPCYYDCGVRIA